MSERYMVPAVGAAIRILAELANADGSGASQADLARETGISKSTMHNLLATLESEGYVRRNAGTRRFHLGGALIPLGAAAAREVRTLTLAIERLPSLASRHELSVYLGQVTPDGDAQIIERAYPPQPMHVGMRIGTRFSYFDGAIGKCLLASIDPAKAEAIVRNTRIPARTKRTVTDPDRLLADVAAARVNGWAGSIAEYNDNIAVAATLRGADGAAEGVLVAVGFPSDLPEERVAEVGSALRDESNDIALHTGLQSDHGAGAVAATERQTQKEMG